VNNLNNDWRSQAACLGKNTEAFFPIDITKRNLSKIIECFKICDTCQVSEYCLYSACINGDEGIWGRTTKRMRKVFLKERNQDEELTIEECKALINYLKDNKVYPYKSTAHL